MGLGDEPFLIDMLVEYVKLHPWFEILPFHIILRSLARDEVEVLYVDDMARFVKLAADTSVRVYRKYEPFYYLRDSFLGRRWNRFTNATGLLKANNLWHTFGLLLPAEDLIFKDHDYKRCQRSEWD